jgi:hypothetical protein
VFSRGNGMSRVAFKAWLALVVIPASATFLIAVSLAQEKLRATEDIPVIAGVHRAAVPAGWIKLTSGTLSLQAPVGTIVEPQPGVDSSGWFIHGPQFYIRTSLGCCVGNYHAQDGRPDCFTAETIFINDVAVTLWTGKGYPKLDCPELNAELYGKPKPNDRSHEPNALWIMMYGDSQDELALVKLMVSTFHFSYW